MRDIVINGLGQIDDAAREFLKEIGDNRIIALYGSMGARVSMGMIRTAFADALGIKNSTISTKT